MDKQENPWDRMDGEPSMWFGRFDKFYRSQGSERTVMNAWRLWQTDRYKRSNKAPKRKPSKYVNPAWYERAEEWDWEKRADAWDETQRQLRLRAEQDAIKEMAARHIEISVGMQDRGWELIENLDAKTDEDFTPSEARMYVKDGIEIERKTRGLPDYMIDIAGMTDEQLLDYYGRLVASLARGGGGGGETEP